jgi:riboflavin kinase/FMN adenylyltransferase
MSRLVVIGNFDGVHRGHQAVLAGAAALAAREGLAPRLLTFAPHPSVVLGRPAPPTLTRPSRKRELVLRAAPSMEVFEQRFDLDVAAMSPRDFAEELAGRHAARRVVVGQNFRFGKGRAGDFGTLVALGEELGFEARSEALVGDADGAYSSTRARRAIAAGDLAQAENVLGRPHALFGRVVHGKHLGRTLGFPTANLEGVEEMLPPPGVYATLVDRVDGGAARPVGLGATSIGKNPTTDSGDAVKVETYVLDFDGDLYGAELAIHLCDRLRDEERFDSLATLTQAIGRDVEQARAVLNRRSPLSSGAWG